MLDLIKIFGIAIYIVMIIIFTIVIIVANAADIRNGHGEAWKWILASFLLGCVWPIVLIIMIVYFIRDYFGDGE